MATIVRANFPYQFFIDQTGAPLDAGYVYIGQVGKDPRTYPVTAYWDTAGTIPAPAPLRTSNGFITRAGTPANIFVGGSYSMLVQDKNKTQVYFVADSAAAAESTTGTVTPADGSLSWEPAAVAALTTASAALRRTGSDTPDPTAPPKPTGLIASAGTLTGTVTWTPASYTVGHGPGRVIVYAAPWVGETAPLVTSAQSLGALAEPVSQETLSIDPQKKVRVWLAFESADGFDGPKSDPVDVTSNLIGRAEISDLLITQRDISDALELGKLVNDPSFAGGAASWTNFVQRAASTDAAAPANSPASYVAAFRGRDCVSGRKFSVDGGDSYFVSIWGNPLSTGLNVGIVIYEYFADGRPVTSQVVYPATLATPNTWTKISGTFKASSGAVAWAIGPHINQAHTGTAVCWFANLRMAQMVDKDLIVQGSVTADTIAARSIYADKIVVGAVTDHMTATSGLFTFTVPTGATSTNSTGGSRFGKARLPRQISRGMLVINVQFDCELDSNLASAINDLKFFELDVIVAALRTNGTSVAQRAYKEPPIINPYRGASATQALCSVSRTITLYLDEANAFDCDVGIGVVFNARGSDGDFFRPQVTSNRTDVLYTNCTFDILFVENKV